MTRREVREGFYDELEAAAPGSVNYIGQEEPNRAEQLPAIVHNDSQRRDPMNNGSAPTEVVRDNSGRVDRLEFSRTMQARFTLSIQAEDEQVKEDIYETVRSHFEQYTHSASVFPDPSAIADPIHDIDVGDNNSDDVTERDPPARVDVLTVDAGFERLQVLERGSDFDTISEVDHLLDAGLDGSTDETYTTTG
jgi:hypothetical protein